MKLKTISEDNTAQKIGHIALDVAGLIPGIGESADLANALLYAKKKQYLNCVLSLLSMIPEIGDVIGKGIKYIGKNNNLINKIILKYRDKITKYWPKLVEMIEKMKEWRPYIEILDKTVNDLLNVSGVSKSETDLMSP